MATKQINQTKRTKRKTKQTLGGLMSGSVLTNDKILRRLPVVAFAGVLMLVYMALGFAVQRRHNYLEKLTQEITELRTISVTTSAVCQQRTRQQNVESQLLLMGVGLKLNTTPPYLINLPDEHRKTSKIVTDSIHY